MTLIALCAATFLFRGKIAEALARNWLSKHGVSSRLQVSSISLTGLSAKLSLGAPEAPDAAVDHIEVRYLVDGPWTGRPFSLQTRSIHFVRPLLRARWDGSRLSFGALQPLIEGLAKGGGAGGPKPDVYLDGGVIVLATPSGQLSVRGGGAFKDGALAGVNATLAPFRLVLGTLHIEGQGGPVTVKPVGSRLSVMIRQKLTHARRGADAISASSMSLVADLPKPQQKGPWVGLAHLAFEASNLAGSIQGARVEKVALSARVDGQIELTSAVQNLRGALALSSQIGSITRGGAFATGAASKLNLDGLELVRKGDEGSLRANGALNLDVASFGSAGATGALHMASARSNRIVVTFKDNQAMVSGSATAKLSGTAIVPLSVSQRWISATPALSIAPTYAPAAQAALQGVRFATSSLYLQVAPSNIRLALAAPLIATSASGARLVIATPAEGLSWGRGQLRGGASVTTEGGGLPTIWAQVSNASLSPSDLRAHVATNGLLDLSFARRMQFAVNGLLSRSEGRVRFDLTSDALISADDLGASPTSVQAFSANLTPAETPLLVLGPSGWRMRGVLRDVRGDMSSVEVGLRGADGVFDIEGRAALDRAALVLSRSVLGDQAQQTRFKPLGLTGDVRFGSGVWTGEFRAAAGARHPIGTVHVRQDAASATGRADIDAGALVFTPGGLQPGDLSPLASFAKAVDGATSFKGWLTWGPGSPGASGGELIAKSLKFTSPIGPVVGVDTNIRFSSLTPLVSFPDQRMTVRLVQAVTPFSDLSATVDFDSHAISLRKAIGAVAKGKVRLEEIVAPLTPGATVQGALVLDHVNIGDIIAASTLVDTLKMDAVLDGRIPFTVSPKGVIVRQGHLEAVGPGRISISRKALTGGAAPLVSASDPGAGFGQDIAYQAMENLAFEQLDASIDTQPADRLGILFHIKGRHDPPQTQRATIKVSDVLRGQPLAKPIALPSDTKIDLTLDTSLNFSELVKSLMQAWRDGAARAGADHSVPVQTKTPQMDAR